MTLRQRAVDCLSAPLVQSVSSLVGRLYGGLSTSLMYHRVIPGSADASRRACAAFRPNLCLAVSEQRFEQQMHELCGHYRCMPMAQAVAALTQNRLEPGTVTVTFDDGYRDNLRVALPILERYGIPVTVYIVTGLVDRTAVLWWQELETQLKGPGPLRFEWEGRSWCFACDEVASQQAAFHQISHMFKRATESARHELLGRLGAASGIEHGATAEEILDWDELRLLDRHPLITIAAHTVSHPALCLMDPATVRVEMRQSRARLEQMLGHPVPLFAYPFGGADEAGAREFELCEAEGFESAVTTRVGHWHAGHRHHMFALPRIMIDYFDTIEDFRFKLSGLDAFLRQRGRRLVTG